MKLADIAAMALHNLWSRKTRTILNILGVVLACVVLAMMLAGTRGVQRGFDRMINSSDDARRFAIRRSWESNAEVPEDVLRVKGKMSEERRKRIRERLEEKWHQDHSDLVPLDRQHLQRLQRLTHMSSVVPQSELTCSMLLGDKAESGSIRAARQDRRSVERLLYGDYLSESDSQEVLLGEFAAYRLGHFNDQSLQELIGQEIELTIRMREKRADRLKRMLDSDLASLTSLGESLTAMRRLVDAVDRTALSERDKALLRDVFSSNTVSDASSSDEFLTERFIIRGIVRGQAEGEGFSIFDAIGSNSGAAIYMSPTRAAEIQMSKEDFSTFYSAEGVVDEVRNLPELTEAVEAMGFRTNSSWWLFQRIDEEVGRAKLAIGALSLLILLISAIGISNTMVVSVLERTGEFGILKAMGARDQHILLLMLLEGAMTGFVGAIVAIGCSLSLAHVIAILVRNYISGRIGQQFDASVFEFSSSDILAVTLLAITVCTLAAIFPAWRAAKLDPVVAMRSN